MFSKKSILLALVSLIFICQSFAYDSKIYINKTTLTVPASGTAYSQPIDLDGYAGYFSVQSVVSGSGTLTISYQLSNSITAPYTWSTPVSASAIATGLTAGTTLYQFEPQTIGKWLRLSFTETGTSNTVTVISNLAGQ